MRAYSVDLRGRVLKDCDAGLGTKAVAEKYSVSGAWVRRVKQRRRETGEVAPRPRPRREPVWAAHADRLRAAVRARPDATLAELRRRLRLAASVTTVWRALRGLGLSLKKKS
jgi:transposase